MLESDVGVNMGRPSGTAGEGCGVTPRGPSGTAGHGAGATPGDPSGTVGDGAGATPGDQSGTVGDGAGATTWAQSTPDERLSSALSLLRRLAQSNLQSLQIAKQLMVAQDLAELRTGRAAWAIDQAAESGGDAEAIESAVAAVAAAERADADERALALKWAVHRGEVTRLTALADELVERGVAGAARVAG